MHGDDRGDLDLGDAEDLVGLVGLPQGLAQGRDEQVAAVPASRRSPAAAAPGTAREPVNRRGYSTLPGFMTPVGSSARLIARITSVASPSSLTR